MMKAKYIYTVLSTYLFTYLFIPIKPHIPLSERIADIYLFILTFSNRKTKTKNLKTLNNEKLSPSINKMTTPWFMSRAEQAIK